MITKRDLLNRIQILEEAISILSNCHDMSNLNRGYNMRTCWSTANHHSAKAHTESAGSITFDQLAQLVIDGTPIIVTRTVEKEVIPACQTRFCGSENTDKS